MTYAEWVEKYRPEKNNIVLQERDFDGCLFETFGSEKDYVKTVPDSRIWTLLEEDGVQWIAAGFHAVNRLGYFITGFPYVEGDTEVRLD